MGQFIVFKTTNNSTNTPNRFLSKNLGLPQHHGSSMFCSISHLNTTNFQRYYNISGVLTWRMGSQEHGAVVHITIGFNKFPTKSGWIGPIPNDHEIGLINGVDPNNPEV